MRCAQTVGKVTIIDAIAPSFEWPSFGWRIASVARGAKRAQREKIKTRLVAIRMDVARQKQDRARDQQFVALRRPVAERFRSRVGCDLSRRAFLPPARNGGAAGVRRHCVM